MTEPNCPHCHDEGGWSVDHFEPVQGHYETWQPCPHCDWLEKAAALDPSPVVYDDSPIAF